MAVWISFFTRYRESRGNCLRSVYVLTRIGEMSYRDRLITLDLLPPTYDRELKDLVFFYKCLFNYIHLNLHSFTNFISHGRTRLSNSFNLKTPICKTSTFQASYL